MSIEPVPEGLFILSIEITPRKLAERRLWHLTEVLRAVRNVNQLITHEKDRPALLRRACGILTETRGYRAAWVALQDSGGRLVAAAESGIGDGFAALRAQFEAGAPPACCRLALDRPGVVVMHGTEAGCMDCALAPTYRDTAALAHALRGGGRDYGVLVVSLPAEVAGDPEEQGLFREVAGDLGFALRAIEADEARTAAERRTELHAAMLDATPISIVMHDPEGRLLYANAQASDLHGYAAEEFLGLNLRDLLPEGEREGMPARVRRIASDGRASFDVTHRRRDGSALPLHVEARAVEWDGRPAILSVQTDLTERLRDESERLRLITAIEQAAEIIVITDARGTIQYVNPAFTAITGYPRAEALGRNPRILKSGVQDAAFYLNLWQTISAGRTWNGRLVNRRKDGTVYTEDAAISPVRDASGAIVNYVAVKRDITNELSMEAQLRQAQKLEAIGTLASGVAHEINNSIMAVTNFAQLLRDRFAGTDREVEQYAGEIIRETERVADIVRSLLQFARQDKQAHSPARLSDIVRTTLSLMDGVLRHDQITLELDVPDELPKVCCRSQQIQQVLMNLLTNARDALNAKHRGYDSDKVLRITARETAREGCRWIRLTVEDHGTGIPPDVFDRIFDPFFTTKPRDKGTGLGLSISHGIVRDHGGKLHAETEFGHWTRFHVDLPLGGDIEARETGAEAQGTAGGP